MVHLDVEKILTREKFSRASGFKFFLDGHGEGLSDGVLPLNEQISTVLAIPA